MLRKLTWTATRALVKPYLTQTRSTVIVERWRKDLPLFEKGLSQEEINKRMAAYPEDKFQSYDVVEEDQPLEDLKVLLIKDTEEFGPKGAVIEVDESLARQRLLLPKLGVYPTEENLKKYKDILLPEGTRTFSTKSAHRTKRYLSTTCLGVQMSSYNPWILEPKHISVSFLRQQINVPEEAIEIHREISGPDMDQHLKEFYVTVKINNFERVKVRSVLFLYNKHENFVRLPPYFYYKFYEPLFEDEREVLQDLPRIPFTDLAKSRVRNEVHYRKYFEWNKERERRIYLKAMES